MSTISIDFDSMTDADLKTVKSYRLGDDDYDAWLCECKRRAHSKCTSIVAEIQADIDRVEYDVLHVNGPRRSLDHDDVYALRALVDSLVDAIEDFRETATDLDV